MKEAARLLANAERPVIVVDRAARTANGVRLLVQLAEALQARVVDMGGRMNFPQTHHLSAGATAVANADVIIGMELTDFWGVVNGYVDNGEHGIGHNRTKIKPDTKLISINSVELLTKSNYQDFQRFQSVDVSMPADAEATLPSLIEAVKAAIPNDRKAAIEKRGEAARKSKAEAQARNHQACDDRLGRQPDQHRAAVDGALGPHQGPRLVDRRGVRQRQQLAASPLADGEAPPLARPLGRLRRRLWRCRRGRRRARQSRYRRPVLGLDPGRRRSDVRAGCDVDRGEAQDSAAVGRCTTTAATIRS